MNGVEVASARPAPDELGLAAIVAAVEVLWPRAVVGSRSPAAPGPWRFSGRWWVTATHDGGWGEHRR